MAWAPRTGGAVTGCRGTQLAPSHSQVSPRRPRPPWPPKRTVTPLAVSWTMACPARGPGFGDTSCHELAEADAPLTDGTSASAAATGRSDDSNGTTVRTTARTTRDDERRIGSS